MEPKNKNEFLPLSLSQLSFLFPFIYIIPKTMLAFNGKT